MSRQFKVAMVLGEAVSPWRRTFDRLDAMIPKLIDDGETVPDDVAAFFVPAEENPGQHRQATARRQAAVKWALEKYGGLPDWLLDAGVTLEDAPPPPADE